MTATVRSSANDILNRVAVETGLDEVTDPFTSGDKNFVQMKALLNIAGEELCDLYDWEFLTRVHSIVTDSLDSGDYALPTDYLKMLNQTGWEAVNQNPLNGPLSAQEWRCLVASTVNSPIYVSFRLREGYFSILPQPVTDGLEISFEYQSRNWVIDSSDGTTKVQTCNDGADIPLFDKTLISRYLKVKWLEAKGLDSTKAQADLNQCFGLKTERDKGAPILNVSSRRSGGLGNMNVPWTNYGS